MAGKNNEKIVSIRFDNAEFKRKIQETILELDKLSAKLNKPLGVDSFAGVSAAAAKIDFTPIVAAIDGLNAKFLQLSDVAVGTLLDIAATADMVGPSVAASFGDVSAAAARVDMTPMTASLSTASSQFASFSATSGQALEDVNVKAESLGPSVAASVGEMSSAVGRFSMEPIAASIEGINTKFLAMATIAITSLQRIVDKAIDAGTNLVKSLTITPISEGFSEYELKMGSIQTIMAGSGASLEVVNQKLEELNRYSDRTIYSFADMTSNIGKFTNAGVSLDGAVSAIQGVANVAAVSGANAEEASRAMYNFSQALSGGYVKLIDWKSIELANMGTKEFKQQLIDSAVAMGTLTKQGDMYITSTGASMNATKEFNNSLQDGWLTSEVLTTTLGRYSDESTEIGKKAAAAATDVKTFSQMLSTLKESAASGWSSTFETIFGGFEEGKTLWTQVGGAISGVINKSADARNAMLGAWKEMGGRDVLIQSFKDAFKALGEVIKPIKEAFREIFPKKTAGDLVILTGKISDFASKLKVSSEMADGIKRTFAGVFSLFRIGIEVVKNIGAAIGSFFSALNGGSEGGGILRFTAGFGDMIVHIRKVLVEGEGIKKFFTAVGEAAGTAVRFVLAIGSAIANMFGGTDASDGAKDVEKQTTLVGKAIQALDGALSGFGSVVDWLGDRFKDIGRGVKWVTEALGNIKEAVRTLLTPDDAKVALNVLQVGVLGGLVSLLKKGINVKFDTSAIEKITGMLDEVTNTLKSMQTQIKANALGKIAIAIGILAVSIFALSFIDPKKLAASMGAITAGFAELVGAMVVLDKKIQNVDPRRTAAMMTSLVGMGLALLLLSSAIKKLSGIDQAELAAGTTAVGVLLTMLITVTKNFTSMSGAMVRSSVSLILLAFAVKVLAGAVEMLAEIKAGDLAKGLGAVAFMLQALSTSMAKVPPGLLGSAVGLIAMGVAINILVFAIEKLGKFDIKELGVGLGAVAIGMMAMAMALAKVPPGLLTSALGLMAVALAINIMVPAIKELGSLDVDTLAKGLITIGLALGGLVLAANAMKGTMGGALAMIAMAGAVFIIAMTVGALGTFDMEELAKGVISLSLALAAIAFTANAMTGAIPGAIAMGIMAGALTVLTTVLVALGQLSLPQLLIGLVGLAAVFGIIGGAAALLTPVIPALFSLGLGIALVGAAIFLFGAGVGMFANGIATLAGSGKKGADAFVKVIKLMVEALPDFVIAVGKALVRVAKAFIDAIPELVKSVGKLLEAILKEIIRLTPSLIEALGGIIAGAISLIRSHGPSLIAAGFELIVAFLTGLRQNISQIATLAAEIIAAFINAIASRVSDLVNAAVNLITSFLSALAQNAPRLITAAAELIAALVNGLAQQMPLLVNAAANLIVSFINSLVAEVPRIAEAGVSLLIALAQAIADNIFRIIGTITQMMTDLIAELGAHVNEIVSAGAKIIADFITGIINNIGMVVTEGAKAVAEFIRGLGQAAQTVIDTGANQIILFIAGIFKNIGLVVTEGVKVVKEFLSGLSKNAQDLIDAGADAVLDFLEGLDDAIRRYDQRFKDAAWDIADALADGFSLGITNKIGGMVSSAVSAFSKVTEGVKGVFEINSPSKVFKKIGGQVIDGFAEGVKATKPLERTINVTMHKIVLAAKSGAQRIQEMMEELGIIEPQIVPVVDLTSARKQVGKLKGLMDINGSLTANYANQIAKTSNANKEQPLQPTGPSSVTFNQTINAPRHLTTNDIYRNTKSQLALAREEIGLTR